VFSVPGVSGAPVLTSATTIRLSRSATASVTPLFRGSAHREVAGAVIGVMGLVLAWL
jgi:hypothetical protein